MEASATPMGMATTNTFDRIATSVGLLSEAEPHFELSSDVSNGGVLLAIPALMACGLLRHTEKFFRLPKGYYGLKSIFLQLAFMAMVRIKSIEAMRYQAPGEWGKLLGLDRAPEVRTIREKIAILASQSPKEWSAALCSDWMSTTPEASGVLYVDGHVRVYHGSQVKLPRHYVSREKLCLRATTDYWVNAMDGQPFFFVNKTIDPGMCKVLSEDIVPRLECEIPNQPTAAQLADNPHTHRFTLVFDREGYSPALMLEMKKKRIACQTYNKYQGEDWPEEEFIPTQVRLASGETVEIKLAERGVQIGKEKLWVREIRKLKKSGTQGSVISTDYTSFAGPVAAAMFARWSQENFFKYMRQHYGLDSLIDYKTQDIPGTIYVVNPLFREIESTLRKKRGLLNRKKVIFASINLEEDIEPKNVKKYKDKKCEIYEEIQKIKAEIKSLLDRKKTIDKRIKVSDLPEDKKPGALSNQSKHFIDTIKMIAYRAETAMVHVLRGKMSRHDDGRSLLRAIYTTETDLLPNEEAKIITVRLHPLANRSESKALQDFCSEMNATETFFPGTDMRLSYELVSSQNP